MLCCRNIYEALNLHCCPDKKKLNNDHLCPHRSEYSSLTHRTWIAVRILRVLRWASAKKDLARQCLSFQSLWFYSVFPKQNSSISNTAVCTKSCSICSLCWPKKKGMIIIFLSPVGCWPRFESAFICMHFICVMYHTHITWHHIMFIFPFCSCCWCCFSVCFSVPHANLVVCHFIFQLMSGLLAASWLKWSGVVCCFQAPIVSLSWTSIQPPAPPKNTALSHPLSHILFISLHTTGKTCQAIVAV